MPSLTQTLFGSLLDSPAAVEITAHILEKAIPIIRDHFTLSANEITRAYQDSCRYSFVAISIGLDAPDSLIKKVRHANITREFAQQIKTDYLQPFKEQTGIKNFSFDKHLRKWAKQTDKLFALKEITEADLAALIDGRKTINISELILEQMEKIEPVDDTLAKFLRFNNLLGDSVLFFFREQFRKDPRVQKTQTALHQERLCIDVQNIQTTLADLKITQEKHPFLTEQISKQIEYLQQWQGQQKQLLDFQNRFTGQLDEVLDWAKDVYVSLDEIKVTVDRTNDLAEEINQKLDAVLTAQQQDNSAQINHADGTVQYAAKNQQLLQGLLAKLQSLSPQNPLYGQVSNKAGRALSSGGSSSALDEAENLFEQLTQQKIPQDDKALAYFNLFQVRWWKAFTAIGMDVKEQLYAKALGSFQQAIELDRRYALHDMSEGKGYYPIKKMLGAGGMGCAFLCESHNFKMHGHKLVVVKCFWEDISGSLEQLFQEPKTMHSIAGAYVPEILDYGYADNVRQTKPYFVTEYFADAVDGEVWLEREGCLDLETGLQVAVQIAEALQQAHAKGICHLDLKPANLLLLRVDGRVVVKVIDFGLARVTASQGVTSSSTVFGQTMFGTLDYAPPEQRGHGFRYGQPSAKSDVFAFGMTMYRLWTNEHYTFRERDLPNISTLRDLLCDCVVNNPEKRPESDYLVKSLKDIVDEQVATKNCTKDELLKQEQKVKEQAKLKAKNEQLQKEQQIQAKKLQQQTEAEREQDEKVWQEACKKNTVESYQAYLNGGNVPKRYADTAQHRIQVLKKEADDRAWNKASQENTVKAYQAYLDGKTLKKYSDNARKQIQILNIEADKKAWQQACEKNTVESYQTYLSGNNTIKKYTDDAKKQLKEAEKRLEDEKAWQWTVQQDSPSAYQAYLDGYTIKKYASNARNALQGGHRYIDNANGTVTDTRTGLIWLKNAKCFDGGLSMMFRLITKLAHGKCGLSDNSKQGDWRLPTKDELEMMVDKKNVRLALLNSFPDIQPKEYWSSNYDKGLNWYVDFSNGSINWTSNKKANYYAWPVRNKK